MRGPSAPADPAHRRLTGQPPSIQGPRMTDLLLVLTPIALLDATSITPLCIVPLILLMGGPRPLAASSSFLLGIFVSYVLCTVLVLLGLQGLIDVAARYFSKLWNDPDTLDIWLGIAIGLVMVLFGAKLSGKRAEPRESGVGAGATPGQAFTGGFVLSLVGLPGAVPLFAAVDQMLRADLGWVGQVVAIAFYNVLFVAPLTGVLMLRVVSGDSVEPLLRRVGEVMSSWGRRLVVVALVVLGLVFVADGIGWLLGHPLLPTFPDAAQAAVPPATP